MSSFKGLIGKHFNHKCSRCGERGFYSPDYRQSHNLCMDCLENANWFWKLVDKL